LHKTFSKLFYAQKGNDFYEDFNKAIDELKSGIYIDSVKYGPEHIFTNTNYFYMVFFLGRVKFSVRKEMSRQPTAFMENSPRFGTKH
jgi:hypothetical protein